MSSEKSAAEKAGTQPVIDYVQLTVACKDVVEATRIASTLLEKHLIACAKQQPVSSAFRWKGAIHHAEEILLFMTSREDLFDKIESEVAMVHSYDTFDLLATPLSRVSRGAEAWLADVFNNQTKD